MMFRGGVTIRRLLSVLTISILPFYANPMFALNNEDEQMTKIVIYRTGSLGGSIYKNLVYLDGRPIGIFGLSSFIELEVSPGEHHVWTTSAAHRPRLQTIRIDPGEVIFVETSIFLSVNNISKKSDELVSKIANYERKEFVGFSPPRLFVFPDSVKN